LIAAAQSGFVNQLMYRLRSNAPSIDPALVTTTGATAVHKVFIGAELDSVLRAYSWGIKVALAIAVAACGITTAASLCTERRNINTQKKST
jgi:hypothetical protein